MAITILAAQGAMAGIACEDLFHADFLTGFRESTPNEFFDALPRESPRTRARHSLGYTYWQLPFETETADTVPPTWKALAEYLKPGVVEARCPTCKNPARARIAVAGTIARAHGPALAAGEPISLQELEFQAGLLDAKVETVPSAFRADWRTPIEIARVGFLPNPECPPTDLWDHVKPDNTGGGNLVSISLAKLKDETIEFVLSRHMKMGHLWGGGVPYFLQPGSSTGERANINAVTLYEYALADVIGVRPPAAYSVATENEMVATKILPSQVVYFRRLTVKIKRGKVAAIARSGWERMPTP
jgi:hypothetical protein